MAFLPEIRVVKSGDRLSILIRQSYFIGMSKKRHYRWRLAGSVSLKELEEIENGRL